MKTNLIHEKQTTGRDPRRVRQLFLQAASQKSIGSSRNNQTQTGPGDTKQGMGFSLMVFISPQGPKSNKPDIAVERDKVHSKPTGGKSKAKWFSQYQITERMFNIQLDIGLQGLYIEIILWS